MSRRELMTVASRDYNNTNDMYLCTAIYHMPLSLVIRRALAAHKSDVFEAVIAVVIAVREMAEAES